MGNIWLPASIYNNFPIGAIIIGFFSLLFIGSGFGAFFGILLICYGAWRKYERAQYRHMTIWPTSRKNRR